MSAELHRKLRELAGRYIKGKASSEEREAMEVYYELFGEAPEVSERVGLAGEEQIGEDLRSRIHNQIYPGRPQSPFYLRPWFSAAAAVLVVCSLAFIFWLQIDFTSKTQRASVQKDKQYPAAPYTRQLTLPDGSSVLLRSGSSLTVLSSLWDKTRGVNLVGEAYFDVSPDIRRPFIVHTGKITTRVLGTSFNIRAYPHDKIVAVAVSSGSVRVEKEGRLLTVLTKNKQAEAPLAALPVEARPADMKKVLGWAGADMNFEEIRFSELAEHLNRRYGVHIRFVNPELANCRLTGGFRGTESLSELLGTLSLTMNTTYSIQGNQVEIDGESCH